VVAASSRNLSYPARTNNTKHNLPTAERRRRVELTNEACAALPAGTIDTLLKPENKAKLTKIFTCHVVAADAMASTVAKMVEDDGSEHDIKTVGGWVLKVKESMDKITLTDESGGVAHVTIANVKQSIGVIHVVDKVLLPKM